MREITPPYRVCHIGLGTIGLAQIGHLLRSPGRWRYDAVIDRSTAAYARFQSRFHDAAIPFYREVAHFDGWEHLDLVVIATTAPAHIALAEAVIRRGFRGALAIEKPVSTCVSEARSLQDLLEHSQWPGQIGVDFNRRCSRLYGALHEVVTSSTLGDLREIRYQRPGKLSMRGSHFIDLANWLARARPVEVSATLETHSRIDSRGAAFYDPPGRLHVRYESGAELHMDMTPEAGEVETAVRLHFQQGEAVVNVDETATRITGPGGERTVESTHPERRLQWMERFFASLLGDTAERCAFCTLDEAILGLEVLTAAYLSHEQGGRPLALPLDAEQRATQLGVA